MKKFKLVAGWTACVGLMLGLMATDSFAEKGCTKDETTSCSNCSGSGSCGAANCDWHCETVDAQGTQKCSCQGIKLIGSGGLLHHRRPAKTPGGVGPARPSREIRRKDVRSPRGRKPTAAKDKRGAKDSYDDDASAPGAAVARDGAGKKFLRCLKAARNPKQHVKCCRHVKNSAKKKACKVLFGPGHGGKL